MNIPPAKTILTLFAVTVLVAGIVWHNVRQRSSTGLVCEHPQYDTGLVESPTGDASVEHTFELRNTSRNPIAILDAQASCGCTTLRCDKIILPGAVGRLTAVMKLGKESVYTRTVDIVVHSNDQSQPYLRLAMMGHVELGLRYTPTEIDLGSIVRGEIKSSEVQFISSKRAATAPLDVGLDNATDQQVYQFKASPTVKSVFIAEAMNTLETYKQTIELSVKNLREAGVYSSKIRFKTNARNFESIEVPVTWRSVEGLHFAGQKLHFGMLAAHTPTYASFSLISEAKPIHLDSVRISNDLFYLADTTEISPREIRCRIVSVNNRPGKAVATITAVTREGDSASAELAVSVD